MNESDAISQAVSSSAAGVVIHVLAQPKAARARVAGMHDGRLKIAVTEPADRGQANEAIIRLLAKMLNIAPSGPELIRGTTSRRKDIAVTGLTADDAIQLLALHLPPG